MNTLYLLKGNALAWAVSLIFLMASGLLWSQDATDPEAQQTLSVTDELDQLEERFYAIRQAEEEAGFALWVGRPVCHQPCLEALPGRRAFRAASLRAQRGWGPH